MSNNGKQDARIVVSGTEMGRAPALKKCDHCGGIADYVRVAEGYKAVCGKCGMQTTHYHHPQNAGEAWNARETANARIITTQEIVNFRDENMDDRGLCACWMETIEGELRAVVLEVSTSMDGVEVYEHGWSDYWPREDVDAEGIRWRLWDKKPTDDDRKRGPWGMVAYQTISEAARAEANKIYREIEARRAAEAKKREEQRRRCCCYCAELRREIIDEERNQAELVCAVDGRPIPDIFAGCCEKWHDQREKGRA